MKMIFGKDIEKDLVGCESIQEFEQKLSQFYEYVSLDNDTRSFVQYFKKYKEDIIKYHVMKGAVRACELSEDNDKFYNNSVEAINKLIKHWQNFKKIDLAAFSKEYEELVQCQESDVLKAYLGLSSPYVVRNKISGYARNFQTEYTLLQLEEKKKVKNTLLNVLVEPNQYKVVKNFKAGSIAIDNARSNTIKAIENTCTITKKSMSEKSGDKNKVVSNEIASIQSSNNNLDNTVYILSEALGSVDKAVIRGSVIKAYVLIEKKVLFLVLMKTTIL